MFTFCFAYQAICIFPNSFYCLNKNEIEKQDATRFHKCSLHWMHFQYNIEISKVEPWKSYRNFRATIPYTISECFIPHSGSVSQVDLLFVTCWPQCTASRRPVRVTNTGPCLRNTKVHHLSARGQPMSVPGSESQSAISLFLLTNLVPRFPSYPHFSSLLRMIVLSVLWQWDESGQITSRLRYGEMDCKYYNQAREVQNRMIVIETKTMFLKVFFLKVK